MSEGIAYSNAGHRTLFKWHRARKHGTDLPFTGERILEGLALGASIEVDLRTHAGGGFAVLHDRTLEASTTGTGAVKNADAATLRGLALRDATGAATGHKVMLLEDLCALIARDDAIAGDGVVQLDLKENASALTDHAIAGFVAAVTPIAPHFILSGGDSAAVAALAAGVPGLRVGYDPCHEHLMDALRQSGDFRTFMAGGLAAMPSASMIYLHYLVVLGADDAGFDIIGACHGVGKTVDAYTINTADAEGMALARRLIGLKADQITTDDPIGLDRALGVDRP